MDVGLYAVSIVNSPPIKGGRDVQFNILALVQYLENFVRAAPDNIKFPFMSIFQGWKRRRIYTRNVYIRVLYRENTIQYASCS